MEGKTKLFTTPLGDDVFRIAESVVIEFNGKRGVASTSVLNGGYQTELKYAYNNSCGKEIEAKGKHCLSLKADTLEGHYAVIACELGLDPKVTTAMGTAALMENMATVSKSYNELTVTAMVTAGVDVNGGRAGDPASYDELTKSHVEPKEVAGTINLFLNINANMPAGTAVRALMTATEAKTAALQELMANSRYSTGLATGSGTDSATIISNLDSDIYVRNAGKHCMLGELIGTAVKEAVKEALDRQTGMNTTRQARVSWQAIRYGITRDKIRTYHQHIFPQSELTETVFDATFEQVDAHPEWVAGCAAYLHLIDQNAWGLLDKKTVHDACGRQVQMMRQHYGLQPAKGHSKDKHPSMQERPFHEAMISPLIVIMAELIEKHYTNPLHLN